MSQVYQFCTSIRCKKIREHNFSGPQELTLTCKYCGKSYTASFVKKNTLKEKSIEQENTLDFSGLEQLLNNQ